MAAKRPSNPLALAVLTLLHERPMHPYEISTTLKERRKEESIKLNYGSLYSVVESLQKRGLIEAQETTREGKRPERTVYTITDTGRTTMIEWLGELLGTPAKEYPQFEAALSLMPALPVDNVIRLLEQRLERLRAEYEYGSGLMRETAKMGLPRLFAIEHEYELALRAAEIEFVQNLLAELRSGTFDGVDMWRRMYELRAAGKSHEEIESTLADEFKEVHAWLTETNADDGG
ncbi:PadR family transcriptional regulator [Actinobacteria bacterium YIM 96077]|uniref:PadR family transcriptional regulator n=1 Tax=Phytoactinopolyspora halophila TaxID=1981511 RepID=A0A329QNZ7_9ACTN|nr:PadR family transcriptional regulator [Phytoactinopolyspora halophila]AYY14538.1 PadR family transcriptional regulator [Actinobacteria bacterium YIM 96077]RAW14085.1 PadR family transcriptional regulator [Phytoactinopolyspora halophila]